MKKMLLLGACSMAAFASCGVNAQVASTQDGAAEAQVQTIAMATEPQTGQDRAAKPDTSVADIVVTANRTESLASKTPVALTAISGENLVKAGITSTTQLAAQVPNLQFASPNGATLVTIRGVTSENSTESGDPSAAFLIDNVYIGRPNTVEVGLFDVNRVEVLRGPQGTLFGRNTTAGLINILTNRPEFETHASLDATVGNYGTYQLTGVVNGPVNDNIAVRASVNYDQRDNYLRTGPRFTGVADPFNENISTRLQILGRWDSGSFLLRGDYARIGGHPFDYLPVYNFYTPTTTGVDPSYKDSSTKDKLYNNAPVIFDTRRDNRIYGVSGELNQAIGPVDLTYIGSYRQFDRDEANPRISIDGNLAYRLTYGGGAKQQTHELRFATSGTGPLKAQVGAFYFHEKIRNFLRLNTTAGALDNGVTSYTATNPLINTSYAFFGQATYTFFDHLRVTGGVRYSHDLKERTNGGIFRCDRFDCSGTVTQTVLSAAKNVSSKVTWRAGVDYDLSPKTIIYANISTGYKAGGFNDGCELGGGSFCVFTRDALYYKPETLKSYDGGVKTSLLGGALRANLNVFHYDYSNIQLSQLVADCGGGVTCTVTRNGGRAKVSGIELDGTASLGASDKIDFAATYLDAKFKEFAPDATHDFAGRPLSRSPKWTLGGGYRHIFELADGGNIEFGVNTKISAKYYLLSIATRNYYVQPSFSRTDATLTYNSPSQKFYLQGFVRNIENEIPVTTVLIGTRSSVQVQAPRTYGVRAGVKF